jgi:hypothetical protein
MKLQEILEELPQLSREERRQVQRRLFDLEEEQDALRFGLESAEERGSEREGGEGRKGIIWRESAKMRVYLDNCSLNRPFDDQKQLRIRLETEAKLAIQEHIHSREIQLAWSYMLDFENSANPFVERRETIWGWKKKASVDVEETSAILNLAKEIQHLGFKSKDVCMSHAPFLRNATTLSPRMMELLNVETTYKK